MVYGVWIKAATNSPPGTVVRLLEVHPLNDGLPLGAKPWCVGPASPGSVAGSSTLDGCRRERHGPIHRMASAGARTSRHLRLEIGGFQRTSPSAR